MPAILIRISTLVFLLLLGAWPAMAFTDIGAGLPSVWDGSLAWGDYDDDGDLDILLTGDINGGSTLISRIYRNDAGVYTDIGAGLIGVYRSSVDWGDYDNDGDLDILLVGETSASGFVSRVYRNDGGVFTDIAAGLEGMIWPSAAWGDHDADGDLDILLTGLPLSGQPATRLYRNDAGAFTDVGAGLANVYESSVAWGDYDNDGDLDILLTGSGSAGRVANVYRNDAGLFTDIGAGLPGVASSAVAWGDYDNDGDLDIALAGNTTSGKITRIYRNDGGSFVDIGAGLLGVDEATADWGDQDNDGDLDLLVTGLDGSSNFVSRIYRNDAGTFTDIGAGLPGVYQGATAWGDHDNDGDLDLLLAGDGAGANTILYRNDTVATNTAPSAPTGLSVNVAGGAATFSWSAASDAQTPSAGLTYNLRIGTTPGGSEIASAMADAAGFREVARLGSANHSLSWSLDLSNVSAATLYWSVQAIDPSFQGSAFAPEEVLILGPFILSISDVPNDQGRHVRIQWLRSYLDSPSANGPLIREYSVWRRPQPGTSANQLAAPAAWSLSKAAATGWDFIGTVPARGDEVYGMVATSLCDSTDAGICTTTYFISAMTDNPFQFYDSSPDSGYSVDNLAPAAPANLQADATEGISLTWLDVVDEDFQYYTVYRDVVSGFNPDETNRIGYATTGNLADTSAQSGQTYYYLVTATDFAGNESDVSNEAQITVTATGVPALPDHPWLGQNVPNPFNPSTMISFALPQDERILLRIFDLQGNLVRTLREAKLPAGVHQVTWDGRDKRGNRMSSGSYIYRLEGNGFSEVKKLTLIK